MKKIGKRKIIILTILVLFIVLLAVVFLYLQSWFHSNGMHFVRRYGQVHLSYMCEGIDQDGNKIESQNVTIDGVMKSGFGYDKNVFEFDGRINMDDLPEVRKYGLFPSGGSIATKLDDELYYISGYTFMSSYEPPREDWREEEWGELSFADIWSSVDVWLKDNQFVIKFVQGKKGDEYYILYSDKRMLDISEIKEGLS